MNKVLGMDQQLKTFYFKTYGCQMNELDSEIMIGQLKMRGMTRVLDEDCADLLIFNTCSIRDLAERKVMGKIGKLARRKKSHTLIGVTGCMAMAKKETLFRKLPHVDFVLGTNNISNLNEVIDDVLATKKRAIRVEKSFEENLDYLVASRDDKIKAYVSIIRGCNKYCTYCVVPYTRGKEVSRPLVDIVSEVKHLASNGYKEITLLGQNVNSYGKDFTDNKILFHDLLYELDKIEGIERIRFMTSHPVDISRELMLAIRDLPSLCEFIHFPIQAGSNRILRKMHRIYTKEEYLQKVSMLKSLIPNAALGTDIIVGFPTETEEEFQETYDVFNEINYATAFLFTYSPRKGTPAMRFKDDVSDEVKNERLHRLMSLHQEKVSSQLQDLLGSELEVLVESVNKRGQLKGRARCWRRVILEGPASLVGKCVTVKIEGYSHETLLAKLLTPLNTLSGCC
jgi:tRNA-2-methylthio-N6-dimethylallyladenosine synthase